MFRIKGQRIGDNSQNLATPERWARLWKETGQNTRLIGIYEKLVGMYTEGHRAYHTLEHISSCLKEFDSVKGMFVHPDEAEIALWFHDAVYDTRRSDNEERSAELAYGAAIQNGLPWQSADRISGLILATKHDRNATYNDSKFVVDIDLSILGMPERIFDSYESAIRREYSWVAIDAFRKARLAILRSFLSETGGIYSTEVFRERYEQQAVANLSRSISRLEQG